MDRCTLGAPFFLSSYVVVYIINSATETVVRRDVPPSPRHITLIEYNEATSLPVFPSISTPQGGYDPLLPSSPLISTMRGNPSMFSSISTPQELLVSLNFNARRNLRPSCIILPSMSTTGQEETPPTWLSAHPFTVSMRRGRSTLFNAVQEEPL